MNLLFITPYLPGPPIFGGQRRIHGLMKELAKRHEVSVIALVDAGEDHARSIRDTESYCRHVVVVRANLHRVTGRTRRVLQAASLFSPQSWETLLHLRRRFQHAIDRHLELHHYDAIVCEFPFMAGFRFDAKANGATRPRLVLDAHNVEYDLARRTAQASDVTRRLFAAVNWRKLRREEVAAWRNFDGCAVTSPRDQALIQRETPGARTVVVPNGVDTVSFQPHPDARVEPMTMLFFGAINYFPNTDGALYFAKEIFPLLSERYPQLTFRIVGPIGEGPVMDLKSARIDVRGFVDDVLREIESAAMVIVPLRIGGGTRLKIVEAMSMGKPIVSTSIGAEGLDVSHDEDILLADTPADFARQVARVLDEPGLAERLGSAARAKAEAKYSWHSAAEKLEQFLAAL